MKKIKIISILSTMIIAGSMTANASPVYNDCYDDTSYGFSATFSELLKLNDDEFLKLDTYNGNQDPETMSWWQKYYFTNLIISNRSENIHLDNLGLTNEDYPENLSKLMPIIKANGYDEIVSIMPWYSSFNEEIYDKAVRGLKNLTPIFYFNESEIDNLPNKIWLTKNLNEIFGDSIEYNINYPIYDEESPFGYSLSVEFKMDDKIEMNKENLLYSARILCCLQQIDSKFYCDSSTNISGITPNNYEIINSSRKVGDSNNDSNFDIRDAAYIARQLASGKVSELSEWTDYNTDGKINIRDAAAIARKLSEKN